MEKWNKKREIIYIVINQWTVSGHCGLTNQNASLLIYLPTGKAAGAIFYHHISDHFAISIHYAFGASNKARRFLLKKLFICYYYKAHNYIVYCGKFSYIFDLLTLTCILKNLTVWGFCQVQLPFMHCTI